MRHSLTPNMKFGIIACIILSFLGFFSMGAMGFGLYYLVSSTSKSFPHPDSLSKPLDGWWPATDVGLLWPFGFIFGAIIVHLLEGKGWPNEILYFLYIPILWLWAAILWLYFVDYMPIINK
ncbi:hypothetical protein [Leptospira santarosai]|uniref:hypothetical protein n=1 Tax=Leptospira santarosai TaxID=28183 RepID=UPI000518FB42|nr:hypothetical protein [Leptospira santarosai]